ncbi:hypothetical protein D9M68_906120 [compost metagenome]
MLSKIGIRNLKLTEPVANHWQITQFHYSILLRECSRKCRLPQGMCTLKIGIHFCFNAAQDRKLTINLGNDARLFIKRRHADGQP